MTNVSRSRGRAVLLVGSILAIGSTARGGFEFNLAFDASVTPEQRVIFESAQRTWQGVISGYQSGISLAGVTVRITSPRIDGVGGILGRAGPTTFDSQGGFLLATGGTMEFDAADIARLIANNTFYDVVLHEMGHVLGIGTLWVENGVYTAGSGRYTGTHGLAAWRTEFNRLSDTFVPVELDGGPGTRDGHWDEVDGGGGNTGARDGLGRDLRFELMTGWLNAPTFMSELTKSSLMDIGFVISVPEPTGLLLLGLGLIGAYGAVVVRRLRG